MFDTSCEFDAGPPPALDPAMLSYPAADEWPDDHAFDDRDMPPVRLGAMSPSAGLAVELQFGTAPLDELDDSVLMDVLEGWSRVASWAQARRSRAVAELARRRARTSHPVGVVDEVAVELHLSGRVAGQLVEHATAVNSHLTATRDLWEQGLLDERRVAVIVDGVRDLATEVAVRVQDTVLPKAPQQTAPRLRAAVAMAVIAADPAGAQARHDAARARRGVALYPEVDGMAVLTAILTAADGVSCYEWLTRLARALGADDPRPMDVRRADLLVGLLTGRIIAAATDTQTGPDTAAPTDIAPAEAPSAGSKSDGVAFAESDSAEPAASTVDPAGNACRTAAAAGSTTVPRATDSYATYPGATSSGTTSAGSADSGTGDQGADGTTTAEPDLIDLDVLNADPATSPAPPTPVGDARRSDRLPSPQPDPPEHRPPDGPLPPPVLIPRDVQVVRPVAPGKPLVQIVVGLDTLRGHTDHPGHLAGYGPITAPTARALATDAVWTRLLTDPHSGALLDHGRTRYTPPVALAEFVRARDQHCMFPGCNRAAVRCELDHTRRFPEGPTDADNLHPLCTRHHTIKHTTDWIVIAIPGGLEWTSPTGRVHRVYAHDHRPEPAPVTPAVVDLDDEPPPF